MIKVLAVIEGTGTGGAETSLASMAPLLRQHINLEVAYFHDRSGAKERLQEAGVRLVHVPSGRNRLVTATRLRRAIVASKPDLVHTMVFEADIVGRVAAFTARVPVVSSIINEMYGGVQAAAGPGRLRLLAAQSADVATARLVRRMHAITHTVADTMAPRLLIKRSKIDVVYRGRDETVLGTRTASRRSRARQELRASTDDQIVLALARQEPQKGLETLIDAVPRLTARFPKLRVLVAGREGSVSRNLDRRIEELGVGNTVKLLGHRSDVPELLCAADVLVFPSRWEGLGGSIIEALALECPIACTDLAVLREVAQAHAEYFEAGSPDALAAAVGRVLDGGTEIERRTAAGRQLFLDRYTTGIVSQQMVDFYRGCLRPQA